MDILTIFDRLTDEEIQETTEVINKEIQELVSNGDFAGYFPDQELVYFNTKGFDINVSTIFEKDKEEFEKLSPEGQEAFPKISYTVILNSEEPDEKDLENYVPFKIYINSHNDIELDDQRESIFLLSFKDAVLNIISVILELLSKKLQLQEGQ